MVLICVSLTVLVAVLLYKNRRDREIIAETLEYYSTLANELSSQLKSHRDLTTFLAHDLKSPLAGIISSAQALELAGQSLPATYIECLKLMQISGRANLRLLSNFIELIGSGSEPVKKAVHSLPDNRLSLVSGLVEPKLIKDGQLSWQACSWDLKTNIPLKHFSTALAEIISVVCSQKDANDAPKKICIEESFDSEMNQLRISFDGVKQLNENADKNTNLYPYTLALQVIEKLGVTIVSIENSEQGSLIELQIPICASVAKENEAPAVKDGQARAEILLELSLRKVKSAALSVGTLSDLQRVEVSEGDTETEPPVQGLDANI